MTSDKVAISRSVARRLRERFLDGATLAELVAETGRTSSAIKYAWKKHGLYEQKPKTKRWTYSLLVELRRRYVEGESRESLAAEHGVTAKAPVASWTYRGVAREIPLDGFKVHDWTMAELRRYRDRWLAGETIKSIADEIGAKQNSLSAALVRAGFKSPEIARERRDDLRSRREGRVVQKAYILRRDTTKRWREIAEEVGWQGRTRSLGAAVKRWAERVGVPPPPRRTKHGHAID
jgi:hypothetical protein